MPDGPKDDFRHTITTVTCRSCGNVYVRMDADGNEYQHFCEMATMGGRTFQDVPAAGEGKKKPPPDVPDGTLMAPSTGVTKPPADFGGTLVAPVEDKDKTARRDAITAIRGADIPEEVRLASRDPARLVAQYVLVKQIGKGGMGTVWKAWDRTLSRWVAIKFLSGESDEDVERFNREAKVAASIRHPNIASIFEIGNARGQHFIAMEFIDGTSMDQVQVPFRDLIEMMRNVALAIQTAHRAGIVHRDLKPQNVMVTKQGWPFVLDFGLAKQVTGGRGNTLSVTGTIMGTPAFMPPEQAQGHTSKIDARSDVYSLGATLYALVTKVVPFKGETPMDTVLKVVKEEPVDPRKHNPACPEEISTIILKAMEKEPERRYQTAEEFAEDLRRYLFDESILARPPSIHTKIAKSFRRNKLAYALGGTITAAAAVVICLLVFLGGKKTTIIGGPDIKGFNALWIPASARLNLLDYKEGEVKNEDFDKAFRKLAEIKAPEQDKIVAKFFADQAAAAEDKLKGWRPNRRLWSENHDEETRIAAWSKDSTAIVALLATQIKLDDLKPLPDRFAKIGEEALHMAAYQGRATIRLQIAPYAVVKSLKSGSVTLIDGGKVVPSGDVVIPDPDVTTPLLLKDLEIRDYDLVLECPNFPACTVKIPAAMLKNDLEYVISGHMGKPGSITLKGRD